MTVCLRETLSWNRVATASLALIGALLSGCGAPETAAPAAPVEFEGRWTISNWEEKGAKTLRYDGRVVTISRNANIYEVQAPDWFFRQTRFRQSGGALVGETMEDYRGLKQQYSTIPDVVLRDAAASGSTVFRGRLTMLRDGRIAAERDNLQIIYNEANEFIRVNRYPGWIRFTLTRQP